MSCTVMTFSFWPIGLLVTYKTAQQQFHILAIAIFIRWYIGCSHVTRNGVSSDISDVNNMNSSTFWLQSTWSKQPFRWLTSLIVCPSSSLTYCFKTSVSNGSNGKNAPDSKGVLHGQIFLQIRFKLYPCTSECDIFKHDV